MPTAEHLARLFGGRLEGGGEATAVAAVVTDSRRAGPQAVFVAVRGEREDGHRYVADAASRGAPLAVVDAGWTAPPGDLLPGRLLRVEDTAAALRRACLARLAELGCAVVGITGSVGKTTAKEMTAHVLGSRARRTPGNLNTWTGIPCSVLSLDSAADVYVAEMAMTAPGEIADLVRMTRPQVGVLLNIGVSHLELLGSQEAIALAKAELLEGLPPDGLAVVNADDPLAVAMAGRSAAPVQWFGLDQAPEPAVRAHAVEPHGLGGTDFVLTTWRGDWTPVRLRVPGRHLVGTACAAAAVATRFGVPLAEIAERLATWCSPEQRGRLLPGPRGSRIYDDSYNSAPASLAAALEVLAQSGGERRVAVVGDMLELGDRATEEHARAGRLIAAAATDAVLVGDFAAAMAAEAATAGLAPERIRVAADAGEAARLVLPMCAAGTTVLVKASHAVGLERLVAALAEGLEAAG